MTYDQRDPDPRRRASEADGLGAGVIATAALSLLALAGIVYYLLSSDRSTISATDKSPAIERSTVPPATTGQGGTRK